MGLGSRALGGMLACPHQEYDPTFWMLAAGNAQVGRMSEARKWLKGYLAMHPQMTIARLRAAQPDKYEDRMAAIFAGLEKAGLLAK